MKQRLIVPLIFLSMLLFTLMSSCGGPGTSNENESNYHSDMVAKGWQLISKWDFFNSIEGWNHENVTGKKKGGYVRVEDGVLEFGYSKDGGAIYTPNRMPPIPFNSYMLIARVKTNNPFGALVGFFTPSTNNLAGATRIRKTDWHLVQSIFSFNPTTGIQPPKNLYPGVQNLTRYDYTYVDWIELWIYPKK